MADESSTHKHPLHTSRTALGGAILALVASLAEPLMPAAFVLAVIAICWLLVAALFWLYWSDFGNLWNRWVRGRSSEKTVGEDFWVSPVIIGIVVAISGVLTVRHCLGLDVPAVPLTADNVTLAVIKAMPEEERRQIIDTYNNTLYQGTEIVGHVDGVLVSRDRRKIDFLALDHTRGLDLASPFKWRGFLVKVDATNVMRAGIDTTEMDKYGVLVDGMQGVVCTILKDDPIVVPAD